MNEQEEKKQNKMVTTKRIIVFGLVAALIGIVTGRILILGIGLALCIIGVVESAKKTRTRNFAILGIVLVLLGVSGHGTLRVLHGRGIIPSKHVAYHHEFNRHGRGERAMHFLRGHYKEGHRNRGMRNKDFRFEENEQDNRFEKRRDKQSLE